MGPLVTNEPVEFENISSNTCNTSIQRWLYTHIYNHKLTKHEDSNTLNTNVVNQRLFKYMDAVISFWFFLLYGVTLAKWTWFKSILEA